MKRHPNRTELWNHAESLVQNKPISAEVAKHVAACSECGREVTAMRCSLEFTYGAKELEPSADMASQILLAAQRERKVLEEMKRSGRISIWRVTQGLACAAALAFVASGWFLVASGLKPSNGSDLANANVASRIGLVQPAADVLSKTNEIRQFADAVTATAKPEQTVREHELRRRADVLQNDLLQALDALERNPGSVRANEVVNASVRNQAQTLKQLYVERSL